MSWFEKIMPSRIKTERRTRSVPEGLWIKCPACDAVLYRAELERNLYVCPKCSHHMRIGARERLERFLDPGTTSEIGATISPEDPLKFRDSKRYRDRLAQAQKATGESDALVGDLNLAEPRARIGFAGPRVIQQTVRETLPEGFQRSEFLLEHGALDMIVDRREMGDRIAALLRLLLKLPAAAA